MCYLDAVNSYLLKGWFNNSTSKTALLLILLKIENMDCAFIEENLYDRWLQIISCVMGGTDANNCEQLILSWVLVIWRSFDDATSRFRKASKQEKYF